MGSSPRRASARAGVKVGHRGLYDENRDRFSSVLMPSRVRLRDRARGRHLAHLTTGAAAGGVCGVGLATFSCERLSSVMEERITEGWTNNWSYSA
jgi:hypothetical protein